MNDTHSRILLYGIGGAAFVGLSYFGFVREVEPDYGTLLSSAVVHAQMAAAIPADVDDAGLRSERGTLVAEAEELLARAERQDPGGSQVWQLRGWMASVAADHDRSAACYLQARDGTDVNPRARRQLGVFAAKSLLNAERPAEALRILDGDMAARSGEERLEAELLRARVLHGMERCEEAAAVATAVAAEVPADSPVARETVSTLSRLGETAAAEAACDRAFSDDVVRDYHVATLKVDRGETDNGVRLLMSCIERGHTELGRLLRQDRDLWVEATGEQSYSDFLESTDSPSVPATPGATR